MGLSPEEQEVLRILREDSTRAEFKRLQERLDEMENKRAESAANNPPSPGPEPKLEPTPEPVPSPDPASPPKPEPPPIKEPKPTPPPKAGAWWGTRLHNSKEG